MNSPPGPGCVQRRERDRLAIGSMPGRTALRMSSLPCALRRLEPHEVEDVLLHLQRPLWGDGA
jgi:hypothetical protein